MLPYISNIKVQFAILVTIITLTKTHTLLMRYVMSLIGYKRVSSDSQSTDRQDLGELDKIFEEKLSGKRASDRPALVAMIDYAREGDTV